MMGCAQALPINVTAPIHHIPIEQLYGNNGYPIVAAPIDPINMTSPTQVYVKSALKDTRSDPRWSTKRYPISKHSLSSMHKTVNFYEQVLVKARTPTPNKTWYEKSSSTMPMRKRPRNDNDDHDYDEDEISSDEQQGEENNESTMFTPRPPTPLRRQSQPNALWHQIGTMGSIPLANTSYDGDLFSTAHQSNPAEASTASSANFIKVRRRLPQLEPSQVAPMSLYQSPMQFSNNLPYPNQTVAQPSTLPSVQSSTQPSYSVFHVPRMNHRTNTVAPETHPPLTNIQSAPQTTYYTPNCPPTGNIN